MNGVTAVPDGDNETILPKPARANLTQFQGFQASSKRTVRDCINMHVLIHEYVGLIGGASR